MTQKAPKTVTADRDHKGIQNGGSTKIQIPKPPLKKDKPYQKCKKRKYHRRRAAMEPIISHQYHILKHDHRATRNFLKVQIGDSINFVMAAAGLHFK